MCLFVVCICKYSHFISFAACHIYYVCMPSDRFSIAWKPLCSMSRLQSWLLLFQILQRYLGMSCVEFPVGNFANKYSFANISCFMYSIIIFHSKYSFVCNIFRNQRQQHLPWFLGSIS